MPGTVLSILDVLKKKSEYWLLMMGDERAVIEIGCRERLLE